MLSYVLGVCAESLSDELGARVLAVLSLGDGMFDQRRDDGPLLGGD
jgi:hypothetical protein